MRKRKNQLIVMALAAVMVTGLAGCSGKAVTDTKETTVASATEATTQSETMTEAQTETQEETAAPEFAWNPSDYELVEGYDDLYDVTQLTGDIDLAKLAYPRFYGEDKILYTLYEPTDDGGVYEVYALYDLNAGQIIGELDSSVDVVTVNTDYVFAWNDNDKKVTVYDEGFEAIGEYSVTGMGDYSYLNFYCGKDIFPIYVQADVIYEGSIEGDTITLKEADCPMGSTSIYSVSEDGTTLTISGTDKKTLSNATYDWNASTGEYTAHEEVEKTGWIGENAVDTNQYCIMNSLAIPDTDYYLLQTVTQDDSYAIRLFLWDSAQTIEAGILPPAEPTTEEDSNPCEYAPLAQTMQEEYQDLYDRADAIGELYGVNIYLADEIPSQIAEFNLTQDCDRDSITECLDKLNEIFISYPEGFFDQLKCGSVRNIDIYLACNITSAGEDTIAQAGGFVTDSGDTKVMVMDTAERFNFYDKLDHEIFHMMEKRMNQYSISIDADAFDEYFYNTNLNPEGFAYLDDYTTYDTGAAYELYSRYEDYFISDYSVTFGNEDRAEIFGRVMDVYFSTEGNWMEEEFAEGMPMGNKLRYICKCIRQCFDTEGWPEVLPWESVIGENADSLAQLEFATDTEGTQETGEAKG